MEPKTPVVQQPEQLPPYYPETKGDAEHYGGIVINRPESPSEEPVRIFEEV